MNGFSIIRGCLAMCGLLVVSGAPLGSGPMYTIIDLGTLGGLSSTALGINNLSQVVGGADLANGKRHAFLWQNGTMTDLGTLPGDQYTEAWDVNNNGVVCGGSSFSGGGGWNAFVWQSGVMTKLPHISGTPTGDSIALAVNDAGQVVGVSNGASVLWQNGSVINLFTTYGVGGTPWDIKASQVALGHSVLDLTTGDATDLGTLGGNITQAFGVNSVGQVTGKSEREPGTANFHAFIWQAGSMTDLSLLGGFDGSSAEAINASGQVVGFGWWLSGEGGGYYFLYVPGVGMLNLETLIPAGSGWSDISPRDINDGGQIVGAGTIGGLRHAFLMTPIPVPAISPVGAIVLGVVMLVAGRFLIRRDASAQR